jgi:ABC-type transport system involved in cytochrome bd biosynthesis fused ATPase/permease subunit
VLGLVILVALAVARVGTFALFQVLLPALFALLTVFAGRRMLERAERMRAIGSAGQRGLRRAQAHVRRQFLDPTAEVEPVFEATGEPRAAPRARVSVPDAEDDIERELEEAAAELERRFERRK